MKTILRKPKYIQETVLWTCSPDEMNCVHFSEEGIRKQHTHTPPYISSSQQQPDGLNLHHANNFLLLLC